MSLKKQTPENSNAQQLLADLKSTKGVKIQCPCCYEARPVSSYLIFTASDMPGEAKQVLEAQAAELKQRARKREQRADRLENAALAAQRVNFGNFAERLSPATPDFPGNPADYRHLGSPIDYISFHGLTETGLINAIDFIDAKAGDAQLKRNQRLIANAIAAGRVSVREIGAKGAKTNKRSKAVK